MHLAHTVFADPPEDTQIRNMSLIQRTGTAPFDGDDTPGHDSSISNNIVRTNDTVTYEVEITTGIDGATGARIEFDIPKGEFADSLPPFCGGGSSRTPSTFTSLPLPLTATSWQSLTSQKIVCVLGNLTPSSTQQYPFTAKVRSEVPNGTMLDPVVAEVHINEATDPAVSGAVQHSVSSRPQYDVSKNSVNLAENTGYVWDRLVPCASSDLVGQQCRVLSFHAAISTPGKGIGNSPAAGPITLTDDLSPASFYGASILSHPNYVAAGSGALARYSPRLLGCPLSSADPRVPASKIAGAYTATNAVRDTGTVTCTQPAGVGTPVDIVLTDTDTSAYTYPTTGIDGTPLPDDRAFVAAFSIRLEVPVLAIRELGVATPVEDPVKWDLPFDNTFDNFSVTDINGQSNSPGADDLSNNHRGYTLVVQTAIGVDKAYIGVPHAPGNTPAEQFSPGWGVYQGSTGVTTRKAGDGVIVPGQKILSLLQLVSQIPEGSGARTALLCDAWDNTKLSLARDNYPALGYNSSGRFASGGEAVWLSGYYHNESWSTYPGGDAALRSLITVEYGDGAAGSGAASACHDSSSPGGWYSDPALVPGNDPAQAANGVYTGVSRVRILISGIPDNLNLVTFFSIGLVARIDAVGQVAPNYASYKVGTGTLPLTDMNAIGGTTSNYNLANNTGLLGDRVNIGSVIGRISKEVRNSSGQWVNTPAAFTNDRDVEYRIQPMLSAAAGNPVSSVIIEDCLPVGQSYVANSASLTPQVVAASSPLGASLTCGAGETYIRWNLGIRSANSPIDAITYTGHVASTAPNGSMINRALITATGDPSSTTQRSAQATIILTSPSGVRISKVAVPTIEVNRDAGQINPRYTSWQVAFTNIQSSDSLSDVSVVDVLPRNGVNGTSYNGTLAFHDATVTVGSGVQILYTRQPNITANTSGSPDIYAPASTVWCDAPSGGVPVGSPGATAADCPSTPAQVTGLRYVRPGSFTTNDNFIVTVRMSPMGNQAGDVYVNQAIGRAVGLSQAVGPVTSPITAVGSSVGNFVWHDVNKNGLQDDDEPGIPGVPVRLEGADIDGNPVMRQVVTDSTGQYIFAHLPASGDTGYTVTFDTQWLAEHGYGLTQTAAGTDRSADSDADQMSGQAIIVVPTSVTIDTVDAGLVDLPGPPAPPNTGVFIKKSFALTASVIIGLLGGVALGMTKARAFQRTSRL